MNIRQEIYTNVQSIIKIKLDNSFLKQSFFKVITTSLDHNIEDAIYFVFVSIRSFKKSFTYVLMSMIFLVEK